MRRRLSPLLPGLLSLLALIGAASPACAQLVVQFELSDVPWTLFDVDVDVILDPANDTLTFDNTGPDELDPIPIPGWLIPPGAETFDTGRTISINDPTGIAVCVGFHMGRLIVKHWIIEIGSLVRGIIDDFKNWFADKFGPQDEAVMWDEDVLERLSESMDDHATELGY